MAHRFFLMTDKELKLMSDLTGSMPDEFALELHSEIEAEIMRRQNFDLKLW